MAKRKPRKPTLNQLKTIWYKKLKAEGFKDIEQDEFNLKKWTPNLNNKYKHQEWKHSQDYYTLAGHFLNEYKFETKLEHIVWEYHMNGISMRNIAKILLKTKVVKKSNRTTVCLILKTLRDQMFKLYNVNTGKTYERRST